MRLPAWSNEEAQLKWVEQRMTFLQSEVSRLDAIYEGRWPKSESTKELEAMQALVMVAIYSDWPMEGAGEWGAVSAMKHDDDLRPMLALLTPIQWPDGSYIVNSAIENLKPETWNLFVQKARLKLGYIKRKVGRPQGRKESRARKLARTATHKADWLVPVITEILRTDYPDQPAKYISSRARELAERIGKVKPGKEPGSKLAHYHGRKPTDRRRA